MNLRDAFAASAEQDESTRPIRARLVTADDEGQTLHLASYQDGSVTYHAISTVHPDIPVHVPSDEAGLAYLLATTRDAGRIESIEQGDDYDEHGLHRAIVRASGGELHGNEDAWEPGWVAAPDAAPTVPVATKSRRAQAVTEGDGAAAPAEGAPEGGEPA